MDTVIIRIGDKEATLELVERGEDNPFSSGSRGYGTYGDVILGGKSYRITLNMIDKSSIKKKRKKRSR